MKIHRVELIENRLSDKQLKKIIEDFELMEQPKFFDQEQYSDGQNTFIKTRVIAENTKDAPDYRIPISYARKIIKTISGYMFKPGLIQYNFENETEGDFFSDLFEHNNETLKTNQDGMNMCINGKGFELLYFDEQPRFANIKAGYGIDLYNHDIEPKLIVFIRLYKKDDVKYYEIYYSDVIQTYFFDEKSKQFKFDSEIRNLYLEIPVIVYYNNSDIISDIDIVKSLIDGYDILVSDSLNEFARFAWAYLLLAGMGLDEENVKDIKVKRIFEHLDSTDAVKFLTKDIPTEYIKFMADWFKKEIHRQSFVPDLDELRFSGAVSGVALDKFLYIMEYVAADKEAFMRTALKKRISLIRKIKNMPDEMNYKIIFNRNKPTNDIQNAQVYQTYYGKGISTETLIDNYADFVEDAKKEMEKFEEENQGRIDLDTIANAEIVDMTGEEDEE